MAIRTQPPSMHAQVPSTSAGQQQPSAVPQNVSQAVTSQNLNQPGQTPQAAAQQLLGSLKNAGFQAPAQAKDFGSQLQAALRQFQQAQGLPQSGKLDAATADALKNLGLAGAPPEKPEKQLKDNFERGGASLLKQGEKSRADVAKNSTPDTNFLDALLNKLGGEHGVTADRAGQVGGTSESQLNSSKAEGAAEVKKANDAKDTAEAKKAGKESDGVKHDLDKLTRESKLQVARGLKADKTLTDEQARKAALKGKDPTERGILEEEAEDDDVEGEGGEGKKKGKGGDAEFGGHDEEGTDTAGGRGPRDGREKSKGNAHSGDNNYGDERRGHASLDDGSDSDAGHYQVPSLSQQAFTALEQIKRDVTASNKATTYTWDVSFYKPGVYSAGQKAQELVHLVVNEATAFDPVWQKAQANVQAMVRKLERDAPAPTLDDIVAALRQARARDGDAGADKVTFRRPPGRA